MGTTKRRPKTAVQRGPVADRVAANVRSIRQARHLTLAVVAERLGYLGRPMLPTQVSKVEKGERRVDADDLLAFAAALDVSPNRLLLPAEDTGEKVALTPGWVASFESSWKWATGEAPLPTDVWNDPERKVLDLDRMALSARENRPHRAGDHLTLAEGMQHEEALGEAARAIAAAADATGLTTGQVLAYVRTREDLRKLSAEVIERAEAEGLLTGPKTPTVKKVARKPRTKKPAGKKPTVRKVARKRKGTN